MLAIHYSLRVPSAHESTSCIDHLSHLSSEVRDGIWETDAGIQSDPEQTILLLLAEVKGLDAGISLYLVKFQVFNSDRTCFGTNI